MAIIKVTLINVMYLVPKKHHVNRHHFFLQMRLISACKAQSHSVTKQPKAVVVMMAMAARSIMMGEDPIAMLAEDVNGKGWE